QGLSGARMGLGYRARRTPAGKASWRRLADQPLRKARLGRAAQRRGGSPPRTRVSDEQGREAPGAACRAAPPRATRAAGEVLRAQARGPVSTGPGSSLAKSGKTYR